MIYLVSRFQGPSKAVRRHQGRAGGQEKLGLGRSPLKQGEDSGTGLDRGKSGTQSSQGRLQTSVVTSGGLLGMFLQVPVSKPTEIPTSKRDVRVALVSLPGHLYGQK